MPLHQRHKEKKYTNYALAAVLTGLVILFFSLTIIKMNEASERANNKKQNPTPHEQETLQ